MAPQPANVHVNPSDETIYLGPLRVRFLITGDDASGRSPRGCRSGPRGRGRAAGPSQRGRNHAPPWPHAGAVVAQGEPESVIGLAGRARPFTTRCIRSTTAPQFYRGFLWLCPRSRLRGGGGSGGGWDLAGETNDLVMGGSGRSVERSADGSIGFVLTSTARRAAFRGCWQGSLLVLTGFIDRPTYQCADTYSHTSENHGARHTVTR